MACVLDRPAPQTLWDRTIQDFEATVLRGGRIVPESNEWYAASLLYAARETWFSLAEQQWKETDPRYACCDNLVAMAARQGIYPRPATFARGYIKITGLAGSKLSRSLRFLFGETYYRIDDGAAMPDEIPVSGFVIVRLVALEPGETGNDLTMSAGSGTIVSTPTGIDSVVTAYGSNFCGGQEAEDCETFRTRYLRRLSHARRATYGNLIEDMLEWPCATRVCLRTCACCSLRNRLDAFVFFDNTFEHGIAPQEVLDDMTAWFFGTPQGFGKGVAPWGMIGQFFSPTAVPINVRVLNLPCITSLQGEEIKRRIELMFKELCPGATICRRFVDAIVIQVLGSVCQFDVEMTIAGQTRPLCDDYTPGCDELPVAGAVTVVGNYTR